MIIIGVSKRFYPSGRPMRGWYVYHKDENTGKMGRFHINGFTDYLYYKIQIRKIKTIK